MNEVAFNCNCGSSFILGGHLWVVISEPSATLEDVIIVNLTSKKPHSDTTTVLTPNDHKFIKHETVINYSDARILNHVDIVKRVRDRLIEPRERFEEDVTRRIQRGLLASPRTPRDIKDFFADNFSS